jgi:DNA-directed RNA polymerase specialized sigma24 family protein
MSMSLTRQEIYVKALLEGYEELQEKKYSGKWHLADEMMDLERAIELADLTDRQREALELVYFMHRLHSEAGDSLGIARQKVGFHLSAAVKKIASIYEQWEALDNADNLYS